jgi:OmpA-OmpF porin, OOP family
MKIMRAVSFLSVLWVFSMGSLHAADATGAKDHSLLKRVEGSEIIWYKFSKFDEMPVALEKVEWDYDAGAFKPNKQEKLTGAHTVMYYKLPGDVSTLEAVKQYAADLEPAGFTEVFTAANEELDNGFNRFVGHIFPTAKKTDQLEYLHEFNHEEQRYMVLKGTGKDGGKVTITLYAFVLNDVTTGFAKLVETHKLQKGQTVVRVDVLEEKTMEARMKLVKAEEITSTIAAAGRIAIYGIYFDTAKAELKPDSAEALAEMAKAIQADASGRFLIVGHTDNQGDYAYNQTLSQKRAAAVVAALTSQYNIPAASLIAVGVGMAAPVAPNTEEAGRAKNRRVEVVKM